MFDPEKHPQINFWDINISKIQTFMPSWWNVNWHHLYYIHSQFNWHSAIITLTKLKRNMTWFLHPLSWPRYLSCILLVFVPPCPNFVREQYLGLSSFSMPYSGRVEYCEQRVPVPLWGREVHTYSFEGSHMKTSNLQRRISKGWGSFDNY